MRGVRMRESLSMPRRKTISRSAAVRRSKRRSVDVDGVVEGVGSDAVVTSASSEVQVLRDLNNVRNCARAADDVGMRWLFLQLFANHPAQVCLLDLDGVIRMVNRSWCSFSQSNGGDVSDEAYVGRSYVDICHRAAESGDEHAGQALVALMDVMTTGRRNAVMTYPCHAPHERRFYRLWIESQWPEMPALIVAHSLIRAEPARVGPSGSFPAEPRAL